MGYAFLNNGETLFPKNEKEEWIYSDDDYVDTWRGLEELVDAGLVKSIGLSNFNSKQVERVLNVARIPPVMIQIESHPYLNQKKLIEFCRSKNIAVTAYSPLGSNDRPWGEFLFLILLDKFHLTNSTWLALLDSHTWQN